MMTMKASTRSMSRNGLVKLWTWILMPFFVISLHLEAQVEEPNVPDQLEAKNQSPYQPEVSSPERNSTMCKPGYDAVNAEVGHQICMISSAFLLGPSGIGPTLPSSGSQRGNVKEGNAKKGYKTSRRVENLVLACATLPLLTGLGMILVTERQHVLKQIIAKGPTLLERKQREIQTSKRGFAKNQEKVEACCSIDNFTESSSGIPEILAEKAVFQEDMHHEAQAMEQPIEKEHSKGETPKSSRKQAVALTSQNLAKHNESLSGVITLTQERLLEHDEIMASFPRIRKVHSDFVFRRPGLICSSSLVEKWANSTEVNFEKFDRRQHTPIHIRRMPSVSKIREQIRLTSVGRELEKKGQNQDNTRDKSTFAPRVMFGGMSQGSDEPDQAQLGQRPQQTFGLMSELM